MDLKNEGAEINQQRKRSRPDQCIGLHVVARETPKPPPNLRLHEPGFKLQFTGGTSRCVAKRKQKKKPKRRRAPKKKQNASKPRLLDGAPGHSPPLPNRAAFEVGGQSVHTLVQTDGNTANDRGQMMYRVRFRSTGLVGDGWVE